MTSLCNDHDEECPGIFAEGYAMKCWLHDPSKGFCPYLRSIEAPEQAELADERRDEMTLYS